jgi:hypothetical protein
VKREKKAPAVAVKKAVPVAASDSDSEKEQEEVVVEEKDEEIELAETVDDDDEEEQEKLHKALEEASTKETVENAAAIVIDHNENMKSKREKLGALIEKESAVSKSAQVKDALISSNVPSNQFQDDIDTWGEEDLGVGEKRKKVLKQIKPKRKRVDMYDLDYDRGKVKKVKMKQDDKFNKPNMFQITAEMKNSKKNKGKKN